MPYKTLFIKLLLAVVLMVTVYASVMTGFNTVLMGVWGVLGFSAWHYWKSGVLSVKSVTDTFSKEELKCFVMFLGFYVVMSLLFYFHFYKDMNGDVRAVWLDNAFYAGIADGMNRYGVEDISLIFGNEGGMSTVYHYFEIWFYALISNLFGITSLQAMLLVGLPFLFSIALIGACAIVAQNSDFKPYVIFFIAFAILFLSIGHRPLISVAKMKSIVVVICWIWFFLELRGKDYFNMMLPLAMSAMLYNTILPCFVVGSTIFVFVLYVKKRSIRDVVTLILIPSAFLLLFYMLNNGVANHRNVSMLRILTDHYSDFSNIGDSAKFWAMSMLGKSAEAVVYLLIIYLATSNLKETIKSNAYAITYVFILFVVAISGWSVMNFHVDGAQVYTNMFSPFFQVLLFYLLILGINSGKKYGRIVCWAIMIIDIGVNVKHINSQYLYTIDQKSYEEIASMVGRDEIKAAYIMDTAFYGKDLFFRNIYFEIPLKEIRLYNKHYYPICLSTREIPPPTTSTEVSYYHNLKANSEFEIYMANNRFEGGVDEAINRFVVEKGIDFLIIDDRSSYNKTLLIDATDTIRSEDRLYEITYNIYKLRKDSNKKTSNNVVN